MKTFVPALVVALAGVATAQLPDLPQCSLQCFLTALGADGCSELTDFKCHCEKSDQLFGNVTPCVQSACTAEEQQEVISGVEQVCKDAGVPIEVPQPSASEAPASSAPASSAAPPASSAPASSPAMSVPAESTAPGYPMAPTSASAMPTMPTGNATSPTGAPQPSAPQFPGAASRVGQAAGLAGAAALAFFAL